MTTATRSTSLHNELAFAIDIARDAGARLRAEFHRDGGPRAEHASKAPIDLELEVELRKRIIERFPDDGFVGEEDKRGDRRGGRRVWYVDPHDGTRAFLRGARGSAVSIALVIDDVPVLGVVYAPTAPDDDGDLIAWAEGEPLTRNGAIVQRAPLPAKLSGAHVVAVNGNGGETPARSAGFAAPARFLSMASIAYRLALVAVGEADAAVSFSSPTDYDVAAGHALVRAVGGTLVDARGRPYTYGTRGTGNSDVFGGHPDVAVQLAGRAHRSRDAEDIGQLAKRYPHVFTAPDRKIPDAGVLRRAQGALLGQVAGDALGQLVEFCSRGDVLRRYPDGVRDLVDGGSWDTLAGQPTDDSEMALIMARSILREGRYDVDAARQAYVDWLRSGPFDVGTTTRRGLTGRPDETSEANGSLMRLSPLAVHLWRQEPEVIAVTVAGDARITHPSEACVDSAVVFAIAIGLAVREGLGPRALYDRVAGFVRGRDDLHAGVRAIFAEDDVAPVADFSRQSGWVLLALRNAFHQLLHAPTLEAGLVATASQGGDADTTSAIAGALLGAVHGRDAVPLRWRRLVLTCRPGVDAAARHPRPAPFWPDDLLALAERLVALGPPALLQTAPDGVTQLAQRRQLAALERAHARDHADSHDRRVIRGLRRVRLQVATLGFERAEATDRLGELGEPKSDDTFVVDAHALMRSSDACIVALGRALRALEEASEAAGDDGTITDDDEDADGHGGDAPN